MGLVDVTCTDSRAGGTDVAVRYTLTAVRESAEPFVAHFLDERHYAQMIESGVSRPARRCNCPVHPERELRDSRSPAIVKAAEPSPLR